MLSRSACRVARANCPLAPTPPITPARSPVAPSSIAGPTTGGRSHQRRKSSSKASCPPGDSKNSQPTTDNNGSSSSSSEAKETHQQDEEKRPASRLTRRKSKDASSSTSSKQAKPRDDPYAWLPHVQPTNHLELSDVKLSSFYSLHRPISVTNPVPQLSSAAAFNAIFEPRTQAQKVSDTISTLSNAVSVLEDTSISAQRAQENQMKWHAIQKSNPAGSGSGIVYVDGQPQLSVEHILRQCRPFNAPPPPVPLEEAQSVRRKKRSFTSEQQVPQDTDKVSIADVSISPETQEALKTRGNSTTERTYETTVTINESTQADGQRKYTAYASPIIERRKQPHEQIQDPRPATSIQDPSAIKDTLPRREPFASRLRRRYKMQLLSVKRQRKLKMKKHKHKKLMRRTRNLRRKEGRA